MKNIEKKVRINKMIHYTKQLCRFDFDDEQIKDFFQTTYSKSKS